MSGAHEVIEAGEIAAPTRNPVPSMQVTALKPGELLALAAQRGASLDELDRFIALKERFEAGEALKAYNKAFAAFKAKAVKLVRDRKITDGPLKGKSHATLASIINVVTPHLSEFGLSMSWKTTKDERDWIEVTCYLKHEDGHVETVSMGGPPDAGGAKNAIQARASTTSYLQRYTGKAILGLAEQDDDDDGNGGAMNATQLGDLINGLEGLKTDAEVKAYWGQHRDTLKDNRAAYDAFAKAVATRRRELGVKPKGQEGAA